MIINNLDDYHQTLAEEKRLRRRLKRASSEHWRKSISDELFMHCNALADWSLHWEERCVMRKQWAKPLENLVKRLKELCDEQTERQAEEGCGVTEANSEGQVGECSPIS